MSASFLTIDDLLAGLMSMGFNHDDCQHAIQMGKLSLNDAADWILSGKPKTSSSRHLVLHQTTSQETNEPEATTSSSAKESTIKKRSSPISKSPPRVVHSRFVESREERGKFLDKKRQKIEKEVKMDKMNRMKAKENILKEIECDRRAQKNIKSESLHVQQLPSPIATLSSVATSSDKSTCSMQIRLPNGSRIRHKFKEEQNISDVLEFIKDKVKVDSQQKLSLLQPFPRLELSDENSTLSQMGLCPSCSLVARLVSCDEPLRTESTIKNVNVSVSSPPSNDVANRINVGNPAEVVRALQTSPAGQHYSFTPPSVPHLSSSHDWPSSTGHRLGYVEEHVESEQPEQFPIVENFDEIPADQLLHHNWGSGRALHDDDHNEASDNDEPEQVNNDHEDLQQQRRDRIISAIEHRQQQDFEIVETPRLKDLHQNVDSLLNRSLNALMYRVGATGRDNLTSLGSLPLPLANFVLNKFIETKKLNPNTITLFRSSPLVKLKLDYYPYATNHLLSSCKMFKNLRVLTLRSCTLLTDKSMETLSLLSQLKLLDMAGCTQITDHIFICIKDLNYLRYLTLDGTHITDKGFCEYSSLSGNNLLYLSLRNIQGITNKSMQNDMKNLKILNIDETNVEKLEDLVNSAPDLTHLSLSGCRFYQDQFSHLAALRDSLTSLNLVGVMSLTMTSLPDYDIGDFVMKSLQEFHQLKKLEMKFCRSLTSQGIKYLEHIPLSSLNLTHHRSINNHALLFIAKITSLRILDLTNTDIDDIGISNLIPLLSRLNELVLCRTPITSQGVIAMISGLCDDQSSLTTLSLQQTNICNALLRSLLINKHCPLLVTLNMRNTKISDSGLRHLVLPRLTSLLLNDTRVRTRSRPFNYPGCNALQHVYVNSVMTSSTLESESDEDQ